MRTTATISALAVAATLVGGSAFAQTPQEIPPQTQQATPAQPAPDTSHRRHQKKSLQERFKELDQNGDGHLTREEWPRPKAFDRLDLNHDGVLTLDELEQARAERHKR